MKQIKQFELSEEVFKTITEQSLQGIIITDLDGHYIFANSTFCKMLGYNQDEILQMSFFDVEAPLQKRKFTQIQKPEPKEIEKVNIRLTLQRKDNSTFISEVTSKKIAVNNQECIYSIVQDISEKVAVELAFAKSELHKDVVMQIANDGIWDWHLETNLVIYDERYYTMAGYKKNAFPCTFEEWQKRVHPDDIDNATRCYQNYLTGAAEEFDVEFRFLCRDQSYMWIQAKGKIVERNEQGKPLRFIGTHSDITMQKKYQEEILQQAHFDSLTYLPNRFLSLDRLEHACIEAKRNQELVVLLFLDLDDFKKVNDSLGHQIGDLLLIEASNRLRHVVRAVDTVGRLGGDEFIIILSGLKDIKEAHPIVENLLNKFREIFVIKKREMMLTASIGIAIFPNDAANSSELLRNADSAMYDAKARGRNTYSYYTSHMNQCAQRRIVIEEQFNNALIKNELSVYFQPKIDIKTLKIMGAEALLRWKNPVLGQISPNEFITIAEQTGHIIALGKFVLQQALAQTSRWQKLFNSNFQIAVNLSPRQFRDPQLLTFIADSLKKYNISADKLELEITEGVLISGHSYVDKILSGLNNQGITMAMDDFGTGYSSLSYLRTYPFDVLKIDRSFISEESPSDKTNALINGIISMSHALGLKVVAEGIETTQQFEQLKAFDCDYAQGYLFSKPISADDMTHLLAVNQHKNITIK
jgi:diguanylate cyclase (GGDEF)-like protein/PAS domain S-box-containing protein